MITVEHLYKSFEDREVLKDINATFRDGEVNLIIGQSGSGKTVLMKNIVGLLVPTSGSIHYDDRDFVTLSKKEKILPKKEEIQKVFRRKGCGPDKRGPGSDGGRRVNGTCRGLGFCRPKAPRAEKAGILFEISQLGCLLFRKDHR